MRKRCQLINVDVDGIESVFPKKQVCIYAGTPMMFLRVLALCGGYIFFLRLHRR